MNWINFTYYCAYWLAALISVVIGLIKGDKLTIKMSDKRNLEISKGKLVGGLFFCIVMAFILSFKRDSISDDALKEQEKKHVKNDSIIQAINYKQIADLERQHTQEIEDIMFKSQKENAKQQQSNTDSLARIFVRGEKRGDKNTKDIIDTVTSSKQQIAEDIKNIKPNIVNISASKRLTISDKIEIDKVLTKIKIEHPNSKNEFSTHIFIGSNAGVLITETENYLSEKGYKKVGSSQSMSTSTPNGIGLLYLPNNWLMRHSHNSNKDSTIFLIFGMVK